MNNNDIESIITKIAGLAHIHLPTSNKDTLLTNAKTVLNYIHQLEEVDTSNTNITIHANDSYTELRDDTVMPFDNIQGIIEQAPQTDNHFFQVPKVIDND